LLPASVADVHGVPGASSIQPDVGGSDHVTPALVICGLLLREHLRRATYNRHADFLEV
jgi:hypothetical protein